MSYDGGYGSFGGGAAPAGEVKFSFGVFAQNLGRLLWWGYLLRRRSWRRLLHQMLVAMALQQLLPVVITQVELKAATEEPMVAARVETHRKQPFKSSPTQKMVN